MSKWLVIFLCFGCINWSEYLLTSCQCGLGFWDTEDPSGRVYLPKYSASKDNMALEVESQRIGE